MNPRVIPQVFLLLRLSALLCAEDARDIVELARVGLKDEVLLRVIARASIKYAPTQEQLAELKKLHISDEVAEEMKKHEPFVEKKPLSKDEVERELKGYLSDGIKPVTVYRVDLSYTQPEAQVGKSTLTVTELFARLADDGKAISGKHGEHAMLMVLATNTNRSTLQSALDEIQAGAYKQPNAKRDFVDRLPIFGEEGDFDINLLPETWERIEKTETIIIYEKIDNTESKKQ